MQKERISITFEVDLDPIPGACHTLEYWVKATEADFKRYSWYNPKITDARVIREAPNYVDQIKALAKEIEATILSEILGMIETLDQRGIGMDVITKYAKANNLEIETAIRELYNNEEK